MIRFRPCLTLVFAAAGMPLAAAYGAPAGSDIANTAQLDATSGGVRMRQLSNTVHTLLGELLDVRLAAVDNAPEQVRPGETGHVSAFVLTNAGNGREAFALTASTVGIDASVTGIWLDRDGNGRFDPAVDTRLQGSGLTPSVASGASINLFVLSDIAASARNGATGSATLSATAATGSGTPGTGYPGAGDEGSNAVVGGTTAAASANVRLVIGESNVALIKSQSVPSEPGRGSIVTYTLEARFSGASPVRDARLVDPIPAGTRYVAGSLRLDGALLSDAADTDAGAFDPAARTIDVALGSPAARVVRVITFQVEIS